MAEVAAETNKKKKGSGNPPPDDGAYENALRDKVLNDLDAPGGALDPKYQDELDALRDEAAQYSDGKLPTLDDESSAEYDEILAAQRGELDMARQDAQDDWLLRAFGSGGQRSTVAGEAAGRMLYGLEQTHRQLLSDDAQRRLDARAGMADRIMQNLGFRAEIAGQQANIALQEFGIQTEERTADKNRRASLLDSVYNRRSSERIATIDADARIKSSRIAASATVKSAEYGYKGALAHASAITESARLGANAAMFGDRKRFRLGKMQMREGARQFDVGIGYQDQWHSQDLALEREKLQYQNQWQRDANSTSRQNALLGAIGSGIGMFAAFSDQSLKVDVRVLPSSLERLDSIQGYQWKWLGSENALDAGVLAQEVEKIMPEAVMVTPEGFKVVNYTAVIGLLVNAVKELKAELKGLQDAGV